MMKRTEVLWLCTCTELPVGIVRQYDEIEGCRKYYIGNGYGIDPDEDVQFILDWGQKFYSLDFLLEFAGRPPLAHCRTCPHYHAYVNAKQGRGLCDHFMHEMPEDGYCSEHPEMKTKEKEP